MTKEYVISRIRNVIKTNGVGGFYIYLGCEGFKLGNGTIINEVRLKSGTLDIEVLEKDTNKVIGSYRLSKKDVLAIYDLL